MRQMRPCAKNGTIPLPNPQGDFLPKSPISRKKTRRPFVSLSENRIKGGCRMKKWCALLMTLLLILTTAGAEEFSGGKDF